MRTQIALVRRKTRSIYIERINRNAIDRRVRSALYQGGLHLLICRPVFSHLRGYRYSPAEAFQESDLPMNFSIFIAFTLEFFPGSLFHLLYSVLPLSQLMRFLELVSPVIPLLYNLYPTQNPVLFYLFQFVLHCTSRKILHQLWLEVGHTKSFVHFVFCTNSQNEKTQ